MSNHDLLDPRAGDRYLRAYALLASEYAGGAKSAIDALLPFVQRAAADFSGQQFDAKALSEHVESKFRVRVPIYMMDAFKHKLLEVGALERAPHAEDVLLCANTEAEHAGDPAGVSEAELADFDAALARFAAETSKEKPFASDSWSEALIRFFAGWEDRKAAIVNGQMILDSKRLDDRVVSSFIASLDKAGANYGVAKKLYLGVLVADFFTCMVEVAGGATLDRVGVVLDTTLLMRLLGTSGKLLQEATSELVNDIQALRGTVYYFSHTYEETVESLEGLSHRMASRSEINRETAQAVYAGEISAAQVQMLVREADKRLGGLGITQYPHAYDTTQNEDQIDEQAFAKRIGGTRFQEYRIRWERDAMSLALVVRMRHGEQVRQLRDAKIVFVTHNGSLVKAAREFVGASAFEVPPMLTTDQISVLSWLERGGVVSDAQLSAKLASACYEAVIPREGWEAEFWSQLEVLKQSEEYRALLNSQLLTDAMRSTVLDRSFGEPTLTRKMSLGPILKELAERVDAERELHVRHAFDNGRSAAASELDERVDRQSLSIANFIASGLLIIILLLVLMLYLVPAVEMAINPQTRGVANIANSAVGIFLSVITIFSLFGVAPSLLPIRGFVASWIRPAIRRTIVWILGN